MFNQYFQEIDESMQYQETQKRSYVLKQMDHVIVDCQFDFIEVAKSVNNLMRILNERSVTQQRCQEIWTQFSIQRYLERINQHSTISEDLQGKKKVKFEMDTLTNQFNVLKDTVRTGNYDKYLREKEREQQEMQLLENIEKISQSEADKPMRYNVTFDANGKPILEEKILSNEEIELIMNSSQQFQKSMESIIAPTTSRLFQQISSAENSDNSADDDSDDEEDFLAQQRQSIKYKQ